VRYVITGANRGIGLELARQLLARGDEVVATARDTSKASQLRGLGGELTVERCDVADAASVRSFAARVDGAVDVLINNAGVLDGYTGIEDTDIEQALEIYDVNALGALRVTQALLPQMRKGTAKKLVFVTSGMGSITDNTSGGAYGYRMSKAALNMASRSLAAELAPAGFISFVINPGWVRTEMGGVGATISVEESAGGLIARIDEATKSDSGGFLDYRRAKTWPY